jgi:catechol 2,3-dioxygenase
MEGKPFTTEVPSIHSSTTLGPITLRVADLERSIKFYEGAMGLTRMDGDGGSVPLGVENEQSLIFLKETPGARHVPHASGLYHFAILVPTRADLGSVLQRLMEHDIRIGQADHLVSEALYLSDPDGNGIEIYRDRPRSEWTWRGGTVEMAVDPLDLDSLLGEAKKGVRAPIPAGTRIGHIHLQVSDVQRAVEFYHGILGFDLTASFQGAAFLSAGGYHHHIGLNSWSSRGAPPAPADATGLESFTILAPSKDEQERIEGRLKASEVPFSSSVHGGLFVRDPWNMGIEILTATT